MYALENLEQQKKVGELEEASDRIIFKDEAVKTMRKILQLKQQKEKLLREENELDLMIRDLEAETQKLQKKTSGNKQNNKELTREQCLHQKLDCYRLTGLSLHSQDKNSIILCFDNNYKAKFYESYYIELIKRDNDVLELKHHSLPAFIPVIKIAEQHLQSGLPEFASRVGDYLYAYVNRREEVSKVRDMIDNEMLQLDTTEAVDFVEMVICVSQLDIKMTLTYQDLLHVLPTRVTLHFYYDEDHDVDLHIPEGFESDVIPKWKQKLKIFPLSEAVTPIIETLQFISVGKDVQK